MNKARVSEILKLILKISVSVILLYLISVKINFKEVLALLLNSNVYYIILALVLYLISVFIASWRNLILLKVIGAALPVGANFRLYMIGLFYNFFIPGGIGGDAYRIYYLRKKFVLPTKRLFLAMLFDRLSGFWAICLLAVLLFLCIPVLTIAWYLPPLIFLTSTVIYFFLMRRFFYDYSKNFLQLHFRAILVQGLQMLTVVSILLSQNFHGKFPPYLFSFLLSTLSAYVPISLSGIGTREYVMTHIAGFFGIDPALAVFLTVSFFLVSAFTALSGLLFFYRKSLVSAIK